MTWHDMTWHDILKCLICIGSDRLSRSGRKLHFCQEFWLNYIDPAFSNIILKVLKEMFALSSKLPGELARMASKWRMMGNFRTCALKKWGQVFTRVELLVNLYSVIQTHEQDPGRFPQPKGLWFAFHHTEDRQVQVINVIPNNMEKYMTFMPVYEIDHGQISKQPTFWGHPLCIRRIPARVSNFSSLERRATIHMTT